MAEQEQEEPLFFDALFHQKRKRGKWRIVNAPYLEAKVADTHAHVHLLKDPALSFARAGANGVAFVCNIVDIFEEGLAPFEKIDGWLVRGSINMRRIARGGC